jgi:hypothetical protein
VTASAWPQRCESDLYFGGRFHELVMDRPPQLLFDGT